MTPAIQDAFAALAEPHRRAITELLRDGEHLAGEVAASLGLTQPSVSKHLKVLRQAGLVEVRTDAQRRWYRLRPDPLQNIDRWLAPYRRMWSHRLDDLEHHLDTMATTPDREPANGPVVATSEAYESKAAAKEDIEEVQS